MKMSRALFLSLSLLVSVPVLTVEIGAPNSGNGKQNQKQPKNLNSEIAQIREQEAAEAAKKEEAAKLQLAKDEKAAADALKKQNEQIEESIQNAKSEVKNELENIKEDIEEQKDLGNTPDLEKQASVGTEVTDPSQGSSTTTQEGISAKVKRYFAAPFVFVKNKGIKTQEYVAGTVLTVAGYSWLKDNFVGKNLTTYCNGISKVLLATTAIAASYGVVKAYEAWTAEETNEDDVEISTYFQV